MNKNIPHPYRLLIQVGIMRKRKKKKLQRNFENHLVVFDVCIQQKKITTIFCMLLSTNIPNMFSPVLIHYRVVREKVYPAKTNGN